MVKCAAKRQQTATAVPALYARKKALQTSRLCLLKLLGPSTSLFPTPNSQLKQPKEKEGRVGNPAFLIKGLWGILPWKQQGHMVAAQSWLIN